MIANHWTSSIQNLFDKHRTESRILVIFVAVLAAVFVFMKAASEVVEGDTLAVDRAIVVGLRVPGDLGRPLGPDWLREAMIDVTSLGSTTVLTLVTVLAVGFLLIARKPALSLFTAVAIAGGALLETTLKAIYARTRPDVVEQLVGVHSNSFPSGHATNSAIVYLTLAVLIARTTNNRAVRVYLISSAILLTLVVGCSRVYLGVHWPTDVMAGWGVGGVWAALCSLIAKSLQSQHKLDAEHR